MSSTEKFDPVCAIHGKRMSEHQCLYCCLCFKSLTPDECNVTPEGFKEDVCKPCAEAERAAMESLTRRNVATGFPLPPPPA